MSIPRRIAVIIGSESDLPQCINGLQELKLAEKRGYIVVVNVITMSIHRNTDYVLERTTEFSENKTADAFIVGAGWANQITGTIDAYLRYKLKDNRIEVIGVPFEDANDADHTETAIRSILHVPGTQVTYDRTWGAGENAFYGACMHAITEKAREITLKKAPDAIERTLNEAILAALEKSLNLL